MTASRAFSALALVASAAAAALVTSCGPGDDGGPKTAKRELVPQWQDVFDGTPEIYAVVRPQAIKRDAVYGTFFKNVLRVAQARSAMRGATTLEALEGCEEIIVGHPQGRDRRGRRPRHPRRPREPRPGEDDRRHGSHGAPPRRRACEGPRVRVD